MTRPRFRSSLALFAAGMIVGLAIPVLSHPAGARVTNLLNDPLSDAFTPGREVLVDIVELPPHGKLDWHWHPGEEFHYYLEGDAVIELAGLASIAGKPGTVGHVAYRQRHRATAGEKGAKIVVFRVHTKGEPWRYLDETQGGAGGPEGR